MDAALSNGGQSTTTPPSQTQHHIVALETFFCPLPQIEIPQPFVLKSYERTYPDQLHERIRDATILITTIVPLDAITLAPEVSPHLKLISVIAVGTDTIDLEACRKRGIRVLNSPGANVDAVAEHALGLYFAGRKKIVEVHNATVRNEWIERKTLMGRLLDSEKVAPLSMKEETVGIIGYGAVGKQFANICRALGMNVIVADRKTSSLSNGVTQSLAPVERTPFKDVLAQSTVVVLSLPRSPATLDLLSDLEFSAMNRHALLINISRGGIVNEPALVSALRDGKIAGYATDVLVKEPAGIDNSPLIAALMEKESGKNALPITITPHLAWLTETTMKNYMRILRENVEGWCRGETPARHVVV